MQGTVANWQFAPSFNGQRAQRLLTFSEFAEIVDLVAGGKVTGFSWEAFNGLTLAGCSRASFLLRVSPVAYDAFFNSPTGYRGQFARSENEGEAANRRLLSRLEPKLLAFAKANGTTPMSTVTQSLRATAAKIWIFESEVESQMGETEPAILFATWAEFTETGVGLLAPEGSCLEVKGGWLNQMGNEQLNPFKAGRSRDIHDSGYS